MPARWTHGSITITMPASAEINRAAKSLGLKTVNKKDWSAVNSGLIATLRALPLRAVPLKFAPALMKVVPFCTRANARNDVAASTLFSGA